LTQFTTVNNAGFVNHHHLYHRCLFAWHKQPTSSNTVNMQDSQTSRKLRQAGSFSDIPAYLNK